MSRLHLPLAIALLPFLAVGCSPRLEDEKTVDLTPEMVQKYSTPSPLKNLTVNYQSDKPVSIYVVDTAQEFRDVENLTNRKPPAAPFAKDEKKSTGELSVTLTEKRSLTILVVCDQATRVKVKMSGK
jgi:hypothetical protein